MVDEYGALQGLVTLEDILEEIVGEIEDEHDLAIEGVRRQPDGSVIVDGEVAVRDLNRALDWDLPDEHAVTVAGLVIHEAQTIPDAGQTFIFHGHRFQIAAPPAQPDHRACGSARRWTPRRRVQVAVEHASSVAALARADRVIDSALIALAKLRRLGAGSRRFMQIADSPRSARMLVVEDEMMIAMLVEDMLADLGCVVVAAPTACAEAPSTGMTTRLPDCGVLDAADCWRTSTLARAIAVSTSRRRRAARRARTRPIAAARRSAGDLLHRLRRRGLRDIDRGSPVLHKPFRTGGPGRRAQRRVCRRLG